MTFLMIELDAGADIANYRLNKSVFLMKLVLGIVINIRDMFFP